MKAIVMTLAAAAAALAVSPASAQWGGPSPYQARYADPYARPALGGCATGRCSDGGCATGGCAERGCAAGACADRCGCEPGLCETGRCGAACDMAACGGCPDGACSDGGCRDGRCGPTVLRPASSARPLPRRPFVDPAPLLGRRSGRPAAGDPGYFPGQQPSPFMADGRTRRNW